MYKPKLRDPNKPKKCKRSSNCHGEILVNNNHRMVKYTISKVELKLP